MFLCGLIHSIQIALLSWTISSGSPHDSCCNVTLLSSVSFQHSARMQTIRHSLSKCTGVLWYGTPSLGSWYSPVFAFVTDSINHILSRNYSGTRSSENVMLRLWTPCFGRELQKHIVNSGVLISNFIFRSLNRGSCHGHIYIKWVVLTILLQMRTRISVQYWTKRQYNNSQL
jgi:hypothetical protein